MPQAPGTLQPAETEPAAPELLLLPAPEPRFRDFRQNLRDLFRRDEPGPPAGPSIALFWSDVFVDRSLPWQRFLQSIAYHVLALALILAGSRFLDSQRPVTRSRFTPADVIHYTATEYLPPLDTRRTNPARTRQADPEYSAQPIISLPPEADNRSQTIVTPPNIQLQHEVALPNVVEWSGELRKPIGPAPAVPASEITRLAPRMEHSVIAPPPNLETATRKTLETSQAVIAPPPTVEAGSARRLGDLNVAHASVIAPAPQLSLDEQRVVPGRNPASLSGRSAQVIAPPPSLGSSGRSRSGGAMIALSLHPAVGAPPAPPAGNRRGNFASTPEGHHGASGAAGSAGSSTGDGSGSGKKAGVLPSGLYVGKTSNATSPVAGDPAPKSSAYSVNPRLMAGATPPHLPARTMQPESASKLSTEERAVFGDRKFYSLSLNMPNLNSAGGSWIIRFAALKTDASSGADSAGKASSGKAASDEAASGDLSAPSATRKVDPAYPLELMKQSVSGTVILYAIIHANGTVGSVRVLRSVDDRLDQYASDAISKWQFQPAAKNGTPVDVEATFWIPFRPAKVGPAF
jgi:TonB family protein